MSFGKIYELELTENRTYRIELEFDGPAKGPVRMPRLTVRTADDQPMVLETADGNGRTVQISFTPTATARHQVVVASTTGRFLGPFTLRVTEEAK